jgi:hypothetical protein
MLQILDWAIRAQGQSGSSAGFFIGSGVFA